MPKKVKNLPTASLVKCASKSTASNYLTSFFCCLLAVGLERLGKAARGVKRVVHSVEQRQIAQLGTNVNLALRKDVAAHHHGFRLWPGLRSYNFLDIMHKWLATK